MDSIKRIWLILFLLAGIILSCGNATATTSYSPAYRVKSLCDGNRLGYNAVTATLLLPGNADIKGVSETGAAYNYLGIETANGNSFEIGLTKDKYDLGNNRWSVFAYANYDGAFTYYGNQGRWVNFRSYGTSFSGPQLVVPDGSMVTISLKVIAKDEAVFEISGYEPVCIQMPGADPQGENQILRRVTSLMTDDPTGFFRNNRWLSVKIKKNSEPSIDWKPRTEEAFRSNNMDKNDPGSSWVHVKTGDENTPTIETIDIVLDDLTGKSVFQVGAGLFYLNGEEQQGDAPPFIEAGRVYLPIRYLSYACGLTEGDINWEQETQTVTLSAKGIKQEFTVGQNRQGVNGIFHEIEAPSLLKEGRLYVPARYVAEAFGYSVEWDNVKKTVFLFPTPTSIA